MFKCPKINCRFSSCRMLKITSGFKAADVIIYKRTRWSVPTWFPTDSSHVFRSCLRATMTWRYGAGIAIRVDNFSIHFRDLDLRLFSIQNMRTCIALTLIFCCSVAAESDESAPTKRRYLLYDCNPGEGFNLRRDVYIRMSNLVKDLRWVILLTSEALAVLRYCKISASSVAPRH